MAIGFAGTGLFVFYMALVTLQPSLYTETLHSLDAESWVVAFFCAEWCRSCREFRPVLDNMISSYPEAAFFWVDIEDNSDMLGELDINKFPTLLIQRGETVAFYSCIHPDTKLIERILRSQMEESPAALELQAQSTDEKRAWQKECNFVTMLHNGLEFAG